MSPTMLGMELLLTQHHSLATDLHDDHIVDLWEPVFVHPTVRMRVLECHLGLAALLESPA
jgi:hypothetical protein